MVGRHHGRTALERVDEARMPSTSMSKPTSSHLAGKERDLPIDDSDGSLTKMPLYQFYFRALICFAAAGTLATNMSWPNVDPIATTVIILLLSYTYGSYIFTRRIPIERAKVVSERLAYGDAALVGVVLNLIDFSLLPSILFITMVQFNALLQGGVKKWGGDNLALLAGILAALLVHRPSWVFSDNLEISAASLIGIT